MPIVSAVLTLSSDPVLRLQALARLGQDPQLSAAALHQDRLPVVLDTPDRAQDKAAWERIEALPGVTHIELVFADFSDLHPTEQSNVERAP